MFLKVIEQNPPSSLTLCLREIGASVLFVHMPEDKRITLLRAGGGRGTGREEGRGERSLEIRKFLT